MFLQFTPVWVAVVGLVAPQGVRTLRRRPGRPATGGMPSTRFSVCVTSLTLPAVVITLNGVPCRRRSGGVCCRSCGGRPARTRRLAPFFARTWEVSTQTRVQSSSPATFSSASRRWCNASKTPASCQRPSLRQQVWSEPKPSSNGSCCQPMLQYSTYKMPCRHRRSSTGRGPGDRSGHGGRTGSISAHNSASTIHGLMLTNHERPHRRTGHASPAALTVIAL